MLRSPHPREARISLDQPTHKYYIDGQTGQYQSVTTVIKNFFAPFPKNRIINYLIKNKQEYRGKTFNDVSDTWSAATQFGTTIHEFIEDYLLEGKLPETQDPKLQYCFEQFLDFWQNLNTVHPIKSYRPEMRIFDEKNCIAGSIDLLVEFQDGTFELFDWKCTAQLRETNERAQGFYPFQNYDDTNLTHYLIQQNLYGFILESCYDIKISQFHLVQFHPSLGTWKQTTLIKIYDDIEEMLKHIKPTVPEEKIRLMPLLNK